MKIGIAKRIVVVCCAISIFFSMFSSLAGTEYKSVSLEGATVSCTDSKISFDVLPNFSVDESEHDWLYIQYTTRSSTSTNLAYFFDIYVPSGSFDFVGGTVIVRWRYWAAFTETYRQFGMWLYKESNLDGTLGVTTTFLSPSSITDLGAETYEAEWVLDPDSYIDFQRLRIGVEAFANDGATDYFCVWQDIEIEHQYYDKDYIAKMGEDIVSATKQQTESITTVLDENNQQLITAVDSAASYVGGVIRDTGDSVASSILYADFGYSKPDTTTIDQGIEDAGNIADTVTGHLDEFDTIRQDSVNEITQVAADASGALTPIWGIFTGVILTFFIVGVTFLIIRKVLGR